MLQADACLFPSLLSVLPLPLTTVCMYKLLPARSSLPPYFKPVNVYTFSLTDLTLPKIPVDGPCLLLDLE